MRHLRILDPAIGSNRKALQSSGRVVSTPLIAMFDAEYEPRNAVVAREHLSHPTTLRHASVVRAKVLPKSPKSPTDSRLIWRVKD